MDTSSPADRVPALVCKLYELVGEFERLFSGRKFTPDGHLVGSIGEVVAAHMYGLTLLPCSSQCHDAVSQSGVRVEIKATQGRSVALREEPEHLLVLHLGSNEQCREVYNGPGSLAWTSAGPVQPRNGQRAVGIARLAAIMSKVPIEQRLPVVVS